MNENTSKEINTILIRIIENICLFYKNKIFIPAKSNQYKYLNLTWDIFSNSYESLKNILKNQYQLFEVLLNKNDVKQNLSPYIVGYLNKVFEDTQNLLLRIDVADKQIKQSNPYFVTHQPYLMDSKRTEIIKLQRNFIQNIYVNYYRLLKFRTKHNGVNALLTQNANTIYYKTHTNSTHNSIYHLVFIYDEEYNEIKSSIDYNDPLLNNNTINLIVKRIQKQNHSASKESIISLQQKNEQVITEIFNTIPGYNIRTTLENIRLKTIVKNLRIIVNKISIILLGLNNHFEKPYTWDDFTNTFNDIINACNSLSDLFVRLSTDAKNSSNKPNNAIVSVYTIGYINRFFKQSNEITSWLLPNVYQHFSHIRGNNHNLDTLNKWKDKIIAVLSTTKNELRSNWSDIMIIEKSSLGVSTVVFWMDEFKFKPILILSSISTTSYEDYHVIDVYSNTGIFIKSIKDNNDNRLRSNELQFTQSEKKLLENIIVKLLFFNRLKIQFDTIIKFNNDKPEIIWERLKEYPKQFKEIIPYIFDCFNQLSQLAKEKDINIECAFLSQYAIGYLNSFLILLQQLSNHSLKHLLNNQSEIQLVINEQIHDCINMADNTINSIITMLKNWSNDIDCEYFNGEWAVVYYEDEYKLQVRTSFRGTHRPDYHKIYYFRKNQEGSYEHFQTISDHEDPRFHDKNIVTSKLKTTTTNIEYFQSNQNDSTMTTTTTTTRTTVLSQTVGPSNSI